MGSLTQQLLVTYLGSVTKMVTMINRTQFKPIKKSKEEIIIKHTINITNVESEDLDE